VLSAAGFSDLPQALPKTIAKTNAEKRKRRMIQLLISLSTSRGILPGPDSIATNLTVRRDLT
jgi:hypothetical protein